MNTAKIHGNRQEAGMLRAAFDAGRPANDAKRERYMQLQAQLLPIAVDACIETCVRADLPVKVLVVTFGPSLGKTTRSQCDQ
jgi:hypothetical protein